MPRGYPDFFGHSIFKSYGNVATIDENGTFAASGATETLLTLSGKGLVLALDINYVSTVPVATIQGDIIFNIDNGGDMVLLRCGTDDPWALWTFESVGHMVVCRDDTPEFTYSFNREIPFVASFTVKGNSIWTGGPTDWWISGLWARYV